MKDVIQKFLPYILSVLIAAGAYTAGAVTDFAGAVSIALDKEQAKSYCTRLLEDEAIIDTE